MEENVYFIQILIPGGNLVFVAPGAGSGPAFGGYLFLAPAGGFFPPVFFWQVFAIKKERTSPSPHSPRLASFIGSS